MLPVDGKSEPDWMRFRSDRSPLDATSLDPGGAIPNPYAFAMWRSERQCGGIDEDFLGPQS